MTDQRDNSSRGNSSASGGRAGGGKTSPKSIRPDQRKSRKAAAARMDNVKVEPMRIQRAIARAGVLSRRHAEAAVVEGRVQVNGVPATIGLVVDPRVDVITVDGKTVPVIAETHQWVVLHKPPAVLSTRNDPQGRKTVFDIVPDVPGLVYVGRLDYMTEGVLILTTDGVAANKLMHPATGVERTYVATVRGDAVTAAKVARRGVELDDGMVYPVDVVATPVGNRRWEFEVTIAEGRKHEVRRLCDALNLEVERLVRTSFGPVRLGQLEAGASRPLQSRERDILAALIRES